MLAVSEDTLNHPSYGHGLNMRSTSPRDRGNHQLESRMRETRLSGSEGGAEQIIAPSLPLSGSLARFGREQARGLRVSALPTQKTKDREKDPRSKRRGISENYRRELISQLA